MSGVFYPGQAYPGDYYGITTVLVSGTASGASATSGTATGTATHHQFSGTATATSATSASSTGVASHHQYLGAAVGESSTDGSAIGTISGIIIAPPSRRRSSGNFVFSGNILVKL